MLIEELAFAIAALFYGILTVIGAYVAPIGFLYLTYRFCENLIRHNTLEQKEIEYKKKVFLCAMLFLIGHLASSKVFSDICFYEELGIVQSKYSPFVCMEWANEGYWNMLGDFSYPLRESVKNLEMSIGNLLSDDLR